MVYNTIRDVGWEGIYGDLNGPTTRTKTWALNPDSSDMA